MTTINSTYIAELAPVASDARGADRKAEVIERRIEARNASEATQDALALAAKVSAEYGRPYGVADVYGA